MKSNNGYWLVLYPFIFIFSKEKNVLFYNSQTGNYIVNISSRIDRELKLLDNSYSIEITLDELNESVVSSLISRLINNRFGELVPRKSTLKKPISVIPQLIIDNYSLNTLSVDSFKKFSEFTELTLYINGKCSNNCANCGVSSKQHLWCFKQKGELSIERIVSFLSFIPFSGLIKLSIAGGDIFSYKHLETLCSYISNFSIAKRFVIHSLSIIKNANNLKWLFGSNNTIDVLFEPQRSVERFAKVSELLDSNQLFSRFILEVISIEDYTYAMELADRFQRSVEIVPTYIGTNREFFVDNIYLNMESILNNRLSMREIFAHQLINTNRFGRLILSADGNIYTSLNSEPVGTIESDIFSLVDEQLKKGSAWRSIRNNDICDKCLFQWLCPSPSEYNEVLDQPNMCDLRSLSIE